MSEYINSSNALIIISGIFLSVAIAFTVGALIQYLSRIIFSFQYEKRLRYAGAIWSGLALTAMTYFLLIKGVKGASFISGETINWIMDHAMFILGVSFVFWGIFMQVLIVFFKINVLRIVVLFGTFSLAMAFAGNDLVNFIGVPIAGFESFLQWKASDVAAEELYMGALAAPVRTDTYLLLAAGLIMVLTLWFSRKARSVTETEVNLGRQDEGAERFPPNAASRGLVRVGKDLGKLFRFLVPGGIRQRLENNFEKVPYRPKPGEPFDPPAFDLVRASVNLAVASMLISFATSLKLPLSTTYVSFMVAMGTSLSDRAWGRDSAVYRVSGVISVIGGWLLTALIAFTFAALFALLISWLGPWAVGGLLILAVVLIVRSFAYHRKKEKEKLATLQFERMTHRISVEKVVTDTSNEVKDMIGLLKQAYTFAISGLLTDDRKKVRKALKRVKAFKKRNELLKTRLYPYLRRIEESEMEGSRTFLAYYDLHQDMYQAIAFIAETCSEHVENVLTPPGAAQAEKLRLIEEEFDQYLEAIMQRLESMEEPAMEELEAKQHHLRQQIEAGLSHQVQGVKSKEYGSRISLVYFDLLLETQELLDLTSRLEGLYEQHVSVNSRTSL